MITIPRLWLTCTGFRLWLTGRLLYIGGFHPLYTGACFLFPIFSFFFNQHLQCVSTILFLPQQPFALLLLQLPSPLSFHFGSHPGSLVELSYFPQFISILPLMHIVDEIDPVHRNKNDSWFHPPELSLRSVYCSRRRQMAETIEVNFSEKIKLPKRS